MLKHKGYTGVVELDDEANVLFGRVIDLNAVITFEGKSTTTIKKAFVDSVDCYLKTCKENNIEPKKSFSGNIRLRIPPDIHQQAFVNASKKGSSLNQFITEALIHEMSV
jgi:predicted HicB family RNase H-like nuclease